MYTINKTLVYNRSTLEAYTHYAYDAIMTLVKALDVFDKRYSLTKYLNRNLSFVSETLKKIIIEEIEFIGASGNVRFDSNGDRLDGFWVFGNFHNGSMNIFGGISQHSSSENASITIDINKVHWPHDFGNRNPLSSLEPKIKLSKINKIAFCLISLMSCISILIALLFVVKACLYRRVNKMDIIMCIGCILSYVGIIIYGILEYCVERGRDNILFDIGCNINLCLFCIVFTLSIIPLFAKPYLFHKILKGKGLGLNDHKLSNLIIKKALRIDFGILFIFAIVQMISFYGYGNIQLLSYEFIESETKQSNDDEGYSYIAYYYPQCVSLSNEHKWKEIMISIYCIILIWKFLEIYYAMTAFRAKAFLCIVCIILIVSIWYVLSDTKTYTSMTIFNIA